MATTEANKNGWEIKQDVLSTGKTNENSFVVFFNGVRIMGLYDSHCAKGTLPHICILPYNGAKVSVSVGISKDETGLKRVKGYNVGYTKFIEFEMVTKEI